MFFKKATERSIEVFQAIFPVKIAAIKVTSKREEKKKIAQRPEGFPRASSFKIRFTGIDLQDGAFVKLTRTPQLAVLKHLIKRLLRKPTQIQDRRLERQPTSRKVSWFMLTMRAVRLCS